MDTYLIPIKYAALFFPVLAALITFPYFLINYKKYGSVSKLRVIIVYTFILYLLCAYFLVILPLPTREYVSHLTTPRVQLIPFMFIKDFIMESGFIINDISTYITAFKASSFYQPLFNVVLTIPFGMYLRYYFKIDLKKTIVFSFLLSLFFEITQLSGLYFIYPRGYRLFDIDDLLFNTFGGFLGYFIISPFMKILPSRDEIDEHALIEGKKVTYTRRLTSFLLDLICVCIVEVIVDIICFLLKCNNLKYIHLLVTFFFLVIIPVLSKGRTIGKGVTNLKITKEDGNEAPRFLILFRTVLEVFIFFVLPMISNKCFFVSIGMLFINIILFIEIIKKKPLIYELLTKTKNSSTLK